MKTMTQQRLVLHFPPDILDQPIIYRLIRDHNLVFNILRARVIPEEEGILVLEITGEKADFSEGAQLFKRAKRENRIHQRGYCTYRRAVYPLRPMCDVLSERRIEA